MLLAAGVTARDVTGFYRLFLARQPESEQAVQARIGESGMQLLASFMCSDEFGRDVLGALRGTSGRTLLSTPADAPLRRWAAAFFMFDDEARREAARIDDSFSLLALVLNQSAVGAMTDALLGDGAAVELAADARGALARDLRGFTTADDLAACYRLFLDRVPEPELALADRPHDPLAATIAGFVASAEFAESVAVPAREGRLDRPMLVGRRSAEWARTRMGLVEPLTSRLLAAVLRLPCVADRLAVMPLDGRADELADTLDGLCGTGTPRRFAGPAAIEPRLDPSLLAGVPIDRLPDRDGLRAVPLTADGAPRGGELAAINGSEWLFLAPAGTLASPRLADAVRAYRERSPATALFYADDLAVDTTEPIDQLRLKPAFDRTLLAAQDYVGAPLLIHAEAFARMGGLDPARRTAAVADLLFRADAAGFTIGRVPEILLAHSGRRVRASIDDHRAMVIRHCTPSDQDVVAGRTAESLIVRRRFPDPPAVTLVIPTARAAPGPGSRPYVERLLDEIDRVDWPMERLTVVVGDDGPDEPAWAGRARRYAFRRIVTARAPGEHFNYAAKMNRLLREVRSEQVVFLNDDVLPTDAGWLRALQTFAVVPDVGGVGARLLFEDGSLQHAGMAPSGWGAAHPWIRRRRVEGSYQDWALVQREWSMVTGAVFATRVSVMAMAGGFDECFALDYNDTDLCLRLRAHGLRIVCNPDAEMVHLERASRGSTLSAAADTALFERRWRQWLDNDPAWHSGLSPDIHEVRPQHDPAGWYR